jgi:hypothetical protein
MRLDHIDVTDPPPYKARFKLVLLDTHRDIPGERVVEADINTGKYAIKHQVSDPKNNKVAEEVTEHYNPGGFCIISK